MTPLLMNVGQVDPLLPPWQRYSIGVTEYLFFWAGMESTDNGNESANKIFCFGTK